MRSVLASEFVKALLTMQSGERLTTERLEGHIQRRGTQYFLRYENSCVETQVSLQKEQLVILNPSGEPSCEEIVSFSHNFEEHDLAQIVELLPEEWMFTAEGSVEKLVAFDFDGCHSMTLHYWQ